MSYVAVNKDERRHMGYQPIENYGIIGDLHTAALVGMNGSIDFLCFPYFDSPSIFAALLDDQKGGRFQVIPTLPNARQKQLYLPDTNILLSRFLCETGVAEVSDFMVIEEETHHRCLVRRAKAVRGTINFKLLFDPKFDYGRSKHVIHQRDHEIIFIPEKESVGAIRLRLSIPVKIQDGAVIADFTLHPGESMAFVLEEATDGELSPSQDPEFISRAFKETMNYWHRWNRKSNYRGRWREMVNRSALTLKLLTSKRHGSIVAAPTFGLPEEVGGVRNWDYRYTWIRDASFTLYGLIRLGYTEEAGAFMHWIEERCAELNPDGSLQIMYGIDGRHELPEVELPHWEGYLKSSPVRVGNAAYNQLQLDIYGELMDSVYLYNKYGSPISIDLWANLTRLINWVAHHWQQKDEGIWEVRGGAQEFLYSRLMCWVALDRAVRLARKRSFPAPLVEWITIRDKIYQDIVENFWNPSLGSFVQTKGATTLDAASLLMPLIKFVSPTDPRWLSTLKAIGKELVDDSLVYRYRVKNAVSDGLEGEEGTFNMCSFWYVECLSRAGDLHKARFIFEKMLGYANHLGLYAEELSAGGRQLGNFPQAFTHLGLISAAYNLNLNLTASH